MTPAAPCFLVLTRRIAARVAAVLAFTAMIAGGAKEPAAEPASDAPAPTEWALVMVEQPSCAYCDRWLRDIGPIYPKTDEGRAAPLRRVDLFDPIPEDLSIARPVRYTPTFLLTENGREVGRIEGYTREDFFWGLLAQEMREAGALAEAP